MASMFDPFAQANPAPHPPNPFAFQSAPTESTLQAQVQNRVASNPFDAFAQPVMANEQQIQSPNNGNPFVVAQPSNGPNSLVTNTEFLGQEGQLTVNTEITVFGTFESPSKPQAMPFQGDLQGGPGYAATNNLVPCQTQIQASSWSPYSPAGDNGAYGQDNAPPQRDPVWEERKVPCYESQGNSIDDYKHYSDFERERDAGMRALRLLEKTQTPGTKISSKVARQEAIDRYKSKKQEMKQQKKLLKQQTALTSRNAGVRMAESSRKTKKPTGYDTDLVVEKCQLDFDRQTWAQTQALKKMSSYF